MIKRKRNLKRKRRMSRTEFSTNSFRKLPAIDRLMARTLYPESGCWLFTGCPSQASGHCKIGVNCKREYIHRISWRHHNGPIPDGMNVLHKCIGTPNCWNPDHLYIGTDKDNCRDRTIQGRAGSHKGERNGRAKLSEPEVFRIRHEYAGISSLELSSMMGVSESAIIQVRNGRTWSHI